MKPFVPNDDEMHLLVEHGVETRLIAREREHPRYEEILESSHKLLHLFDPDIGHSHD